MAMEKFILNPLSKKDFLLASSGGKNKLKSQAQALDGGEAWD